MTPQEEKELLQKKWEQKQKEKEAQVWKLHLKDGRVLPVLYADVSTIQYALKPTSHESFIEVKDEKGRLEVISKFEIKYLQEPKTQQALLTGYTYSCEYGDKHAIQDTCMCGEKWGVPWPVLWRYYQEIKEDIYYNHQITKEMTMHAKNRMAEDFPNIPEDF